MLRTWSNIVGSNFGPCFHASCKELSANHIPVGALCGVKRVKLILLGTVLLEAGVKRIE